jgi:DNA (cytosine-5)-methyltransferase 1
LFDVTIELLKGIMPKVFTFENVPGLVHGKAKGYFVEILNKLIACGYKVEARIVDAAYLGVPQARRRLIFVGVRNDLVKLGFNPVFPKPKPYTLAVRDVLPNIHYIKTKVDGIPTYVVADRPSRRRQQR